MYNKLNILMELLKDTLAQRKPNMSLEQKITALLQLLEALVHIHGLNIAHLDLGPKNVMFDSNGDLKLMDLGLAKICYNYTMRTLFIDISYKLINIKLLNKIKHVRIKDTHIIYYK